MKNRRNAVAVVCSCYRLVFSSSPALSICEMLSYGGSAIAYGMMPLAWKGLFDAVPAALAAKSFGGVVPPLFWLAALLAAEVTFRLLGRLPSRLFGYNEIVILALKSRLFRHATAIPLAEFERRENHDAFERASAAVGQNAATQMVDILYQTPAMLLSMVVMTVALWTINPLLVAVALLSVVPVAFFQLVKNLRYFRLRQHQSPGRRALRYYWSLFINAASVRGIRCWQAQVMFTKKWQAAVRKIVAGEQALCNEQMKKQLLPDLVKICGNCFGVVLAALLMFLGRITFGAFGAVINAFNELQETYLQVIYNAARIRSSYLFFSDYLAFTDIPAARHGACQMPCNFTIELENVSFGYPEGGREALRNISLKIACNEKIAIVGANGSGKSTLCRIISGLYAPGTGSVRYNGIAVADYQAAYTGKIAAVFQDYVRYRLDIRSNVGFGDIAGIGSDRQIFAALQKAGVSEPLTGIDCQLGRDFGGRELSGGQWQQLALARGYMADDTRLLILDEPTAAIDPLRETEIFRSFLRQAAGKTAIVVTHRIGAAKLADRIIVLHEGQIMEDGNHEQLMSLDGAYAALFREQAKWYLQAATENNTLT